MSLKSDAKTYLQNQSQYPARGEYGDAWASSIHSLMGIIGQCPDVDAYMVHLLKKHIYRSLIRVQESFYGVCDAIYLKETMGSIIQTLAVQSTLEKSVSGVLGTKDISIDEAVSRSSAAIMVAKTAISRYNSRLSFDNAWLEDIQGLYAELQSTTDASFSPGVVEVAVTEAIACTLPKGYSIRKRTLNDSITVKAVTDVEASLSVRGVAIPAAGIVYVGDTFESSGAVITFIQGTTISTTSRVLDGETDIVPHYSDALAAVTDIGTPEAGTLGDKGLFVGLLSVAAKIGPLNYGNYANCLRGFLLSEPEYGSLLESLSTDDSIFDKEIRDAYIRVQQYINDATLPISGKLHREGSNVLMRTRLALDPNYALEQSLSDVGMALTTGDMYG